MAAQGSRAGSHTAPVRAGDDEARLRGTQKTVLERVGPPSFPIVIEMRTRAMWVTHWVQESVDALLNGKLPNVEVGPPPAFPEPFLPELRAHGVLPDLASAFACCGHLAAM